MNQEFYTWQNYSLKKWEIKTLPNNIWKGVVITRLAQQEMPENLSGWCEKHGIVNSKPYKEIEFSSKDEHTGK